MRHAPRECTREDGHARHAPREAEDAEDAREAEDAQDGEEGQVVVVVEADNGASRKDKSGEKKKPRKEENNGALVPKEKAEKCIPYYAYFFRYAYLPKKVCIRIPILPRGGAGGI